MHNVLLSSRLFFSWSRFVWALPFLSYKERITETGFYLNLYIELLKGGTSFQLCIVKIEVTTTIFLGVLKQD